MFEEEIGQMSLQVEKLEGNMAKLTIEASAEDFEKAVEKAYQRSKSKVSVPGFRKGKVPRKIIEQMYGKEIFYEDAANIAIPSAYAAAVDECTEEIVSQPAIEIVQLEAGKPFIFTAEVALKPDVTLGKYKEVEVDKIDILSQRRKLILQLIRSAREMPEQSLWRTEQFKMAI